MGLAILRYQGLDDDVQRFELSLGSNAYFEYAIGSGDGASRDSSMRVLATPSHRSDLLAAPPQPMRWHPLEVPARLFSPRRRFIQLRTYRTADRQGPAVSDLVAVFPSRRRALSLPMSSLGESMTNADTIPFNYRELGPLSNAQGGLADLAKGALGALTGGAGGGLGDIAKQIASTVGPQLLDYVMKEAATLGGGKVDAATLQLAREFVGFLTQRSAGATSTKPALTKAPSKSSLKKTSSKKKLSKSKALALDPVPPPASDYADAMAVPAALAGLSQVLPSLMPMIERVMTPETAQALIGAVSPTKILGTLTEGIGNGLKALNRAQLEMDRRTMDHLAMLMRPASTDLEMKMLEGMSVERGDGLDYRRVNSVQLDFDGIQTVTVAGRPTVAYRHGRDLAFPLSVQTHRPIRKAGLQLEIKHAHTRELVLRRRMRLDFVQSGRSARAPRLSAAEAAGLSAGGEYLATLTLVWKNPSGRMIGTSRTQLFTLLDGPLLGDVTPEGATIPLSDPARHRLFWHKIWEGEFTDQMRRLALDCRYYYTLEAQRERPARMKSVLNLRDDRGRSMRGRLKSGMVLDLYALNDLASQLPGGATLDAQTLDVLRSDHFSDAVSRRGRKTLDLEGEDGQRAAVWVFPEVALSRVTLLHPDSVNGNGLVTSLRETSARFPCPTRVHFVATRED